MYCSHNASPHHKHLQTFHIIFSQHCMNSSIREITCSIHISVDFIFCFQSSNIRVYWLLVLYNSQPIHNNVHSETFLFPALKNHFTATLQPKSLLNPPNKKFNKDLGPYESYFLFLTNRTTIKFSKNSKFHFTYFIYFFRFRFTRFLLSPILHWSSCSDIDTYELTEM